MKKLITGILCVFLLIVGIFCFASCKNSEGGNLTPGSDSGTDSVVEDGASTGGATDTENENSLRFNELYVFEEQVRSDNAAKQTYYQFEENGVGSYHYYYDEVGPMNVFSYTIKFRYEIMNDFQLVCFFDSVTYDDAHTGSKSDVSEWSEVLVYSDNYLLGEGNSGTLGYIAVSYLEEIPNFGMSETNS